MVVHGSWSGRWVVADLTEVLGQGRPPEPGVHGLEWLALRIADYAASDCPSAPSVCSVITGLCCHFVCLQAGDRNILIATDVASRGLDIPSVSGPRG